MSNTPIVDAVREKWLAEGTSDFAVLAGSLEDKAKALERDLTRLIKAVEYAVTQHRRPDWFMPHHQHWATHLDNTLSSLELK